MTIKPRAGSRSAFLKVGFGLHGCFCCLETPGASGGWMWFSPEDQG